MLPLHEALRIARVLHRVWAGRHQPKPDRVRAWREFDERLAEARRAERRVHLAARHGLHLTLPRVREVYGRHLDSVARTIEQLSAEQSVSVSPAPDLRTWFEEIRQLNAEFGAVVVRWPDQVLRIVTEPIVLEGVELGPFAIEFGWDVSRRFRGVRSFEVIALEPNPATGREDVVHPHVEGRRLCAGDAADPLREAVDAGRLADAFLLVQSVLAAYNPRSPYVPLAEWEGYLCGNCGRRGDSRDSYCCEECDARLCDQCSDSCSRCSDTRCPDCLTACAVCDERLCRGCLLMVPSDRLICRACRMECPACRTQVASDEIEEGRCGSCPEPDPVVSPSPPLETVHAA